MKAVITTGGKQYLVKSGDVLDIDLLHEDKKSITFEPLLVITDTATKVGAPTVSGHTVTAEIVGDIRADKVTAIRYKAKKRVKKVRGHRQKLTQLKINSIK